MTELEGYIRYWVTELKAILQGMSLDVLGLVLRFTKFLKKQVKRR